MSWTFDESVPSFDAGPGSGYSFDGAGTGNNPVITLNPNSDSVAAPATATFAANATNYTSVQWQSSPNDSTWTNIPGATGLSYTTPPTSAGYNGLFYRAVFTNLVGGTPYTTNTLAAELTVTNIGVVRMLPQYVFGPGVAWATQNTNAAGQAVTNPPPILIAQMQDIALDMSAELKELYGTGSFAVAIGRGKQKMNFKIKNAQINGALWNSMYFGQTLNTGVYTAFYDIYGTAVPSTPYQTTPVTTYAAYLPGGATYGYDLGVRDVNNLPLQRVASGPASRQYSLSGGVYTFAAADVGIVYYISFNYTAASTVAKSLPILNLPMGYAPTFQLDLIIPYQGNVFSATFPNCMQTKLGLSTKLDDFAYPEMDVSAFAPGSAQVGTLSWSQ